MRKSVLSFTLSLAALGLVGATPADGPAADPTVSDPPTQEEIVALERERYRRVTVQVSIEGQGPYRFLVDTGAEATVVSREIATELALAPAGSAIVVGMASEVEADLVDVANLSLADMDFCCLTSPVLSKDKIGADGILGLDSLQDSRVLLDFEEGTLTVHDARPGLSQRGYEIIIRAKERLGQLIIADARIDGIKTSIVIDTGSQISIGNSALKKRLRTRNRGMTEWEDVHGNSQVGDVMVARTVRMTGFSIVNIPIAFADAPPFRHLGMTEKPALILGIEHLKMFRRVAIDFKSRKILFDLPSGTVPLESIFRKAYASRLGED
jgi:predicted aspartyl protease